MGASDSKIPLRLSSNHARKIWIQWFKEKRKGSSPRGVDGEVLVHRRRGGSDGSRWRWSTRRPSGDHGKSESVVDDLEGFLQRWRRAAGVRRPRRCALGVKKIGQEKGIWEAVILPGGSGGRGESGGAVGKAGVLWFLQNWSPEFCLAAARSGRGRAHCSGAQRRSRTCQRGARDRGKNSRTKRREGDGQSLPKTSPEFVDTYGSASLSVGSLAAIWLGFWEGTIAGAEVVFVDMRERQNRNRIHRINHEEIALSQASLSDEG
jgi:hypothetical protein